MFSQMSDILFSIEMDVFDNENAIEGITSRLNFIDFVYTSIARQFVITIKESFYSFLFIWL